MRNKRKDLVLTQSEEDGTLVMRAEDIHPYSGISIEEWGAANCRLLFAMMSDGAIKSEEVPYYLAYTTTIFEFASRYHWNSVLDYDYQYRERQAQHGFAWGSLNPNSELQLLRKTNTPKQGFHYNYKKNMHQQGYKPGTSTEFCRQWLARGDCRYGSLCRYRHARPEPKDDQLPTSKNSQGSRPFLR